MRGRPLAWALILLIALIAVPLAWLLHFHASESIKASQGTRLYQIAEAQSARFSHHLLDLIKDAKLLYSLVDGWKQNPPSAEPVGDTTGLEALFTTFAEQRPSLHRIRFVGQIRGEPTEVIIGRGLGEADIKRISPSPNASSSLQQLDQTTPVLGELTNAQGRWSLSARLAVRATPMELVGVLELSTDMGHALEHLSASAPSGVSVYLADHKGRFIIHPTSSGASSRAQAQEDTLDPDLRWNRLGKVIQGQRPMPLRAVKLGDTSRLVEVIRLPFDTRDSARDLTLLYALPASHARDMALSRVWVAWIAIAVAALALMALVRASLSRRSNSLAPLNEAIQAMIDGNWEAPLPNRDESEMGRLSGLVSDLLAKLKSREKEGHRKTQTLELRVKEQDKALTRALDLQQAILNNAGSAIITTDEAGLVTSFNPAAEHMLGYQADDVVGSVPMDLFFDHDEISARGGVPHDTDSLATLAGLSAESLRSQNEWTFIHKDGEKVPVLLSVRQLRDDKDQVVGELTIAVDMSDLKAKEYALREAMQLARDADRAKGEFLANMSHEIRTPMNGIIGLGQLLLDTSLDRTQREFAESLLSSAHSLLTILNDILDYSKIEAGRMELERAPFKLNDLLNNVTGLFVARAEEKRIELLLDVAPDVPQSLRGDSLRLSQIINNLVSNAIKFTDQGEIRIRVERAASAGVKLADLDELRLRFSVSDSGRGMSENERERLFKAFQQADASITRRYGGTGLGLTICQRLTELMHGEIGVESEPGKGSSFWFTVRLHADHDDPLDVIPSDFIALDALKPMRTMLVDDQPGSRELVSRMLAALAFPVTPFESADDALQAMRQASDDDNAFELLLIDWNIAGSAGQRLLDCYEILAALPEDHLPAVAIMVSRGFRERAVAHLPANCQAEIIDKPVTAAKLNRAIAAIQSPEKREELADTAKSELDLGVITQSIKGSRLLLVEDNPTNQLIATNLLARMGLQVDVAENGREGVDKALARSYQAILMDLAMPVMDGLEATRELRRFFSAERLPIIAMTAAAFDSDRDASRESGMNAHITKPIDVHELAHTLVELINKPEPEGTAMEELIDLEEAPEAETASGAPIRSTADDEVQAFDLPGFDFSGVMEGLGDDWGLLRELLRSFHKDFNNASERMQLLLEAEEIQQAQRLAHTVKGLARTLGADELAKHATEMDAELKAERIPEQGAFDASLADALRAIESLE
ncbi:MAG: ATP-binding protein [Gammaproteobacteria bacterium]